MVVEPDADGHGDLIRAVGELNPLACRST